MTGTRRERGIYELYREDPDDAERQLLGADPARVTRRGLLRGASAAAIGALLGGNLPFGRNLPAGLVPAAFAESTGPFEIPGKDPGLVILNDYYHWEGCTKALHDFLSRTHSAARIRVLDEVCYLVKPEAG